MSYRSETILSGELSKDRGRKRNDRSDHYINDTGGVEDERIMDKRHQINLITTKNLAVIWLVAAGILIATDQISFAISYTSVITIMTAISTISYDTFDNGNAFLFTLPFSRKEYTREKYLFSLFWGMITVIGGILLVGIVTAAKGTLLMRSEEIVMAVLLNIPMLLIFQSMALPFLLKYEAEKGRIALAAMIGGIVFVVIFFFKNV